MLRLAALSEVFTPELKDLIFQHVEDFEADDDVATEKAYEVIKEKIISWTSNRLSAAKSVELNVGNVVQTQSV